MRRGPGPCGSRATPRGRGVSFVGASRQVRRDLVADRQHVDSGAGAVHRRFQRGFAIDPPVGPGCSRTGVAHDTGASRPHTRVGSRSGRRVAGPAARRRRRARRPGRATGSGRRRRTRSGRSRRARAGAGTTIRRRRTPAGPTRSTAAARRGGGCARSRAAGGAGAACPARTASGPRADPPHDREQQVDERQRQHGHRDEQGQKTGSVPSVLMKACGSALVVAVVAAAARIRPTTIEPESPMKILAGKKLCGRKPEARPGQRRGQQGRGGRGGRGILACPGGRRRRRRPGGDRRDAGGQPVQAVDEVHRVDRHTVSRMVTGMPGCCRRSGCRRRRRTADRPAAPRPAP